MQASGLVLLHSISSLRLRHGRKQLLDRNRRILNDFLDTREDLEVVRPQFGTVMFPRVRRGTSEDTVPIAAREV